MTADAETVAMVWVVEEFSDEGDHVRTDVFSSLGRAASYAEGAGVNCVVYSSVVDEPGIADMVAQ